MSGFEIAGIALAGPAVIAGLIKTSIAGYRTFHDTKLVGKEYQQLKLEIDVQEERYLAWIRNLSNHGGDLSSIIDPKSRQYELILTTLAMIAGVFVELDKVDSRYGLTSVASEESTATISLSSTSGFSQSTASNRGIRNYLSSTKSKFRRFWRRDQTFVESSPLPAQSRRTSEFSNGTSEELTHQDFSIILKEDLLPIATQDNPDDLESHIKSLRQTELNAQVPGLEHRATQLATMAEKYQQAVPTYRKYTWQFDNKEQLERFIADLTKYVNYLHILTTDEFSSKEQISIYSSYESNSNLTVAALLGNGLAATNPEPEFQEFDLPMALPFPRLSTFCGRQDIINEIFQILDPGSRLGNARSRKMVVLHGMGGLGKSQIALEYAYCYCAHYSTILWIDATSPASIEDSSSHILAAIIAHYAKRYRSKPEQMFANIAIDLKIPGQIDNEGQVVGDAQKSQWRIVRNWLARNENSQWLLIADGLNDEEDSKRLLEVLPTGSQGQILVTSRVTLPGCTIVDIPVMDKESGVRLLLGEKFESAIETVRAVVEQIVDLLGNLPLALAQAVAYINMRRLDYSRYLERLKKDLDGLIDQIALGYKNGVFSGWRLAFKALKKHHPDCIPLLRICSFLSPHGISIELLSRGIETMDWFQNDQSRLDDALDYLIHYGLAKRILVQSKGSNTIESIWIHHLVQRWARNTIDNNELSIGQKDPDRLYILQKKGARDAIRLVGCGVTDIDSNPKPYEWVYERENWAHLRMCCEDYIPKYKFEDEAINDGKLGRALRKLGDWKTRWGEYEDSLALARKAIRVLEATVSVDPSWEAELLLAKQDEAEIYAHGTVKTSIDAHAYINEIHTRQEALLGENHPRTLFNKALLGLYLTRVQKPLEARDVFLAVLERMEAAMEETNIIYVATLSYLGHAYEQLGDYEAALKRFTKVDGILQLIAKNTDTPNPSFSLSTIANIGVCKLWLGQVEDGLKNLDEATRLAEATYGLPHKFTVQWLEYLYTGCVNSRQFDKASLVLEKIQQAKELATGTKEDSGI
ncbi:hypothetical protein TWF730_004380 [Orbilia blumenaviensis]|uniref:Prion-inhibition and propagation HeLo domain-containing protein n=1 Tax=Orbilia blumenaviensis TaxID=1796055 RepID=A0AAV9TYK0_9PEZI